jgi:hypothetical protein
MRQASAAEILRFAKECGTHKARFAPFVPQGRQNDSRKI